MHYQEIARIAQQAWDKTKDKSDPVWESCDPHHRQVFVATATGVINSGHAVNDFEHAVKKLVQDAEEKQKAIAEVQAENPTAHADELQARAAGAAYASPSVPVPSEVKDVPQINPPSPESQASSSKKKIATSPRKTKAKPQVKSSKKGAK
jgi:hypothetical protein